MDTRLFPGVRRLLTLVLVWLPSLSCGAHAPALQPGLPFPTPRPNLLRNGSFSDGTATWRAVVEGAPDAAALAYDQAGYVTVAVAGAGAPLSAGWSQTVPVSAGAAYCASYRVRAERLVGRADMTLSFRDEAGRPLFETGVMAVTGDTAWATYAWRCRAPAGATQATVRLGVVGAAGRAAFDEACLAPDDAPDVRALIVDYGQGLGRMRALPGLNGGAQPALARLQPARVRVGGLGAIFPNARADPADPASYDFQAADTALAAATGAGAEVLLQLDDDTAPGASAARWAEVAQHVLMHYNEGWADGQRYGIRYVEVALAAGPAYGERVAAALQALRARDRALQVGAALPELAGAEALLSQLAEQEVRPDFFSWAAEANGSPFLLAVQEASLEQLLAAHGLAGAGSFAILTGPFALPWAASAYGAAHLAAALSYAQDTPLARAYFGEAGGGQALLDSRGGLTATGEAWRLLAQLGETPQRLLTQGGDDLGFTILAGRSDDGCLAQILIADSGSRSRGYRLGLAGFPPGYRYTVTEIAEGRPTGVIAEGAGSDLQDGVLALRWHSPDVHLIRMEWP